MGKTKSNCLKCNWPDNEEMVQCDHCDNWFHFVCVGVDSSVADRSWSCELCAKAVMNETLTTSESRAPALSQSSPILGASGTSSPQQVATTTYANVPLTSITEHHAIATAPTSINFNPSSHVFVTAGLPAPTTMSSVPNTYRFALANHNNFAPRAQSVIPVTLECQNNCVTTSTLTNIQQPHATQTSQLKSLQIQRLEEEMKLQQQFIETKYKILAQGEDTSSLCSQATMFANSPTAAQLAARQVIPKRLPIFNGDPEEWPLFISSLENSTATAGFTNAENLVRLQDALKGRAREMVRSKLCLPDMVPQIISTLRMCFGSPEHILERVIHKAKNMPAIKDKLEMLIDFSLSVQNICATMESCQMHAHMHNPILVKELVEKLPNNHKLNWAMHPKNKCEPIVKTFSDWLHKLAEAASTLVSLAPNKGNASVNIHMVSETETHAEQPKCSVCRSQDHTVEKCKVFQSAPLNRKWDYVHQKHLCRQCLGVHRRKCTINKVCGIDGCEAKHHQMLHKSIRIVSSDKIIPENAQVNAHSNKNGVAHSYFRIVPVNIHAKNKNINTFALLDEGSTVTLIEKATFNDLGLQGVLDPICLKWTGNTTRIEDDSFRATIEISSAANEKFKLKDVHTVESLDLSSQSLNAVDVIKRYPHLKGVPLPSYKNAKPTILIGLNNWTLAVPHKIKEGKATDPIASKCRLGWALQGCASKNSGEYQLNVHICDCQHKDQQLHEDMKQFFNLEHPKPKQLLSADDNRAMQLLEGTCKKYEDRYEVGLLWRTDDVNLPESYSHAFHRFMCLHKKFIKQPFLKATIQAQIENLIAKGYARKLTSEEAATPNKKAWYLPIFIVNNPNKPRKPRLVWDAAAQSNGVSLNDYLLSGPDLLNSLVEVLLAFRVGKVAVCGDIAEMFHRINVNKSDMHAQRFLWLDANDDVHNPSIYVMRALTFGISCAPCIAHFIRNKNAEQFQDEFPRAVEAIRKYHYVDDFIDSADDDSAAIQLATQVKQIHAAAGFNIRNYSSNSKVVLNHLEADPETGQSAREWSSTTKILGLFWDPANDQFKYIFRFVRLRRDVIQESIVPTKREILQVLMSIYDPLGFVSCYTIGLKILLQEIWRSGIGWDEPLSDSLYGKWCKWKAIIAFITAVRIPRCYSPAIKFAKEVQLHTFVDAGENGYAAVCYLRFVYPDSISTALVAAKSKVSPLKPLSIPRLELQAAVIGVRLASTILNVQRICTTSQFYWTDSKTTLRWLHSDPKCFQQFVMHRVGEILESTDVSQWKYTPSTLNPADLATKTTSRIKDKNWFTGPDFLLSESCDWPQCEPIGKVNDDDAEIRHTVLTIQTSEIRSPDFEYFSCWKRLQRAIATFILFIKRAIAASKKLPKPDCVTTEMYETARIFLQKYAQAAKYSEEIYSLQRGKLIEKTSQLISLNIYLDENNVLRSKGRAEHLNNHGDVVILPQNHRITFLIVRWFHERLHHQMHETVVNRVRSQFYIPRLRVLYRNVRQSCQICKNINARPRVPQMAALPPARLAAFERPFTYTGIDYFGPLFVAVGRRREKRWGAIFTCLTVRAIHIELAHSLDANSCVMVIQNFISRHGLPREIYSDNGTNFKAAAKILSDQIKWKFNPPSAPHMGGAWERLIRSIKKVLNSLCPTLNFNDESLRCALSEVEFTINARPLTFVSVDSNDDEAITPNHLLIGSSDGFKPICDDKVDLRQRWNKTQKFADQFWNRWLKDYLPVISRRSKWFNKQPPIKVGDVVVIVDSDLPRNSWPKGVIVNTTLAKDGQVRTATVKTQTRILQRPVAKLAVLDVGVSGGKLAKVDSFTGEGMLPPFKD